MAIVLDTWALLAHLRDEPAGVRVREAWLKEGAAMSSINLGEALYLEVRVRGGEADDTIEKARKELAVVDPDWALVVAAARVKAQGGVSYADAFCVATAERLGTPLWTGDPEIIELAAAVPAGIVDLREGAL